MKALRLVNAGTDELPLYVNPSMVLAVMKYGPDSRITMSNKRATSYVDVPGSPHEVAQRLLGAMEEA